MDFGNMKRKELQALCKQHNIPANLTNLEMANKLVSLLKGKEKSTARGKSCLKSTVVQVSENMFDGVNRQSKKVKFSPENETFEFLASERKPEEIGREARARRRSMLRQVAKSEGIVSEKNADGFSFSEDIVDNPVRLIRSRAKKVTNENENVTKVVETKSLERCLRSVAFDSLPRVETGVLLTRRSSESKEMEKKKEKSEDDTALRKNQTKRISRKRGTIIDDEVSEIEVASRKVTEEINDYVVLKKSESQKTPRSRLMNHGLESTENKGLVEDEGIVETEKVMRQSKRNPKQIEDSAKRNIGLGEVEAVGRGRTRRQLAQLVEIAKVTGPALKTETELEVVLQIEEPSRHSCQYGDGRESINSQTDKMKTDRSKNDTKSNTLIQSTAFEDIGLGKVEVVRRGRTKQQRAQLVEDAKVTDAALKTDTELEVVLQIEESSRCSSRYGYRRQSVIPQMEKMGIGRCKDETENNTLVQSTTSEDNARPKRRNYSRCTSIAVSDAILAENDTSSKPNNTTRDTVLEEKNVVIEGSSLVEEPPRHTRRNGNRRMSSMPQTQKKGGDCSKGETENNPSKSLAGEENSTSRRTFSRHKSIMTSDTTLAKNVGKHKSTSNTILEEENVMIEGSSHPRISTRNGCKAPRALVTDGTSKAVKRKKLSSRSNLDSKKQLEMDKYNELEGQASGPMKFQNDDEESRDMTGISDFEIVLNIDAEGGKDKLSQDCAANDVDSDSDSSPLLESEVEPIIVKDVVTPEATLTEEDYSLIDQPECIVKPAENLDLENEQGMVEKNESQIQASDSAKLQDCEEFQCLTGASGFKIVLDIDSQPEVDESHLLQDSKQSKPDENLVLELEMDEINELRKHTDSSSVMPHDGVDIESSCGCQEKHFVEPEVSYGEKNIPIEEKGTDRQGLERSAMVSDELEFSIGKDQPSVDPEVDKDIKHNVEGCSPQHKEINTNIDHYEIASKELENSCVHISYRKEVSPSKMEEKVRDEVENPAVIEPEDGEDLMDKFYAEGRLSPNCKSVLKENFEIINEEDSDSSFHDTSDQNRITSFEVEEKRRHEVEMSVLGSKFLECTNSSSGELLVKGETVAEALVMNSYSVVKVPAAADSIPLELDATESVQSSSMNSRYDTSNLKEQKHPVKAATPISVSNEIKSSLMVVNLDCTPASDFEKVHSEIMLQEDQAPSAFPTIEPIEDLNKVINKNTSGRNHHSPLPQEDNLDKLSSSFTLCQDFEVEKPESSVFAQNLIASLETHNADEPSKNQNFGNDSSTEPKESEGTENEFDADCNILSAENKTQPFEATSQTASAFAEHPGNGNSNFEVSPTELRLLFDDEMQGDGFRLTSSCSIALPSIDSDSLTESKDDETSNEGPFTGNNFVTEAENIRKSVTKEDLLGPIEIKDEDTRVVGSCDGSFANTPCARTINILEEENQGICELVSEHGHDNTTAANYPVASYNLADENASEHATSFVGKVDIVDEDSKTILMEGRDGITQIYELTPVESDEVAMELESTPIILDQLTIEKESENLENATKEGVETQFDDGMIGDSDGDEMEMAQELVHTEKDDSPSYFDHFSGHEKTSTEDAATSSDNSFEEDIVKTEEIADKDMADSASGKTSEFEKCVESSQKLSKRDDGASESHTHTINDTDLVQCVDKPKDYAENQTSSQVTHCWTPDPEFGNSQASPNRDMFSSWELNLFFEGEATKSTSVVSKVPFNEDDESVSLFDKQLAEHRHSVEEQVDTSLPQESLSGDKISKEIDEAKEFNYFTRPEDDVLVMVPSVVPSRDVIATEVSDLKGTGTDMNIEAENSVDTTSIEVMVDEANETCDVAVAEVSCLEGTEDDCFPEGEISIKTGVEAMNEASKAQEAATISDSVIEDRPAESADRPVHGIVASENLAFENSPLDKSKQLNSSRTTLDDGAGLRGENFGSESNIREGELGSRVEGEEVKEFDMFDDGSFTEFDIFPTQENTECKCGEVSEQAREITRNENCPQELSEELAAETEDAMVKQQSFCTDYLGDHTEVQKLSQDCTPNAAGDDSTLVSSSFNQGQSFEIANSVCEEGSATEDTEKNVELVNVENAFGIDEKYELSAFETSSAILKMEKPKTCFVEGTPKKLVTYFDMKENATSIKRENLASVTAKSTQKRRALVDLPEERNLI